MATPTPQDYLQRVPINYIYDPKAIGILLDSWPLLRQEIEIPENGLKTDSFPEARKTPRQIYRVLSNTHYRHLNDLLNSLEYCIGKGWRNSELLRTRELKDFGSAISELLVAEFFLRNGLTVKGCDDVKGSDPVPDLLVRGDGWSLVAEVYSPFDWDGLHHFEEELRLAILHIDIPRDFSFDIRMDLIRHFDSEGKLLRFNPWGFSQATDTSKKRLERLEPILRDLGDRLQGSAERVFESKFADEPQNLLTSVRFDQIEESSGRVPVRSGFLSCITRSGYAPDWMFDTRRGITGKLRKRQTQRVKGEHLRALIVDVSKLAYVSEFRHPWYRSQFKKTLGRINLATYNTDFLVLCCSRVRARMRILMVVRNPNIQVCAFDKLLANCQCISL